MSGKYHEYPEYKNTENEYIGSTPKLWGFGSLKRVVDQNRQITYGIVQAGQNVPDGVPYIRPADMRDEGGVKNLTGLLRTSLSIASSYERSELKSGDLVCSIGPSFGKVMVTPDVLSGANLTQGTARVAISKKFHTRYYFWVLRSSLAYQQWESSVGGATFRALNLGPLADTYIPIPPHKNQVSIAGFLDHETAKIDTLIDKQQQLIQLLKEKRQTVISHAVTKGLDPNVPMKDSGVEWLGAVPEHWSLKKFGHISNVVRGGSPRPAGDPTLFNGDYSPWVTVAEITKDNDMFLEETETFLTKKGSDQCRVFQKGTLVLSNSGATLGVPKILNIDANANDGVVGFESLDSSVNIELAYLYLTTLTENLRESIKQGSGQPNLNTDIVKNIVFPGPPPCEQDQIVTEIKDAVARYKSLTNKAHGLTSLLKERRTALISAAVTGKIDVRHWQPSEPQARMEATA
ncbi:MAG: restriction endonuclease subunit S [Motiliproteus sp.]